MPPNFFTINVENHAVASRRNSQPVPAVVKRCHIEASVLEASGEKSQIQTTALAKSLKLSTAIWEAVLQKKQNTKNILPKERLCMYRRFLILRKLLIWTKPITPQQKHSDRPILPLKCMTKKMQCVQSKRLCNNRIQTLNFA